MENVFSFEVGEEFSGYRLDKWLAVVMPDFSRSKIQQFIKQGFITKNNLPVDSQRIDVEVGDVYVVNVPDEKVETVMKPENIPLDILYEDDDIIVVNKPAGMVVHQGAGVNSGTLVNALLYHCNGKLANVGGEIGRQGIVHRLDKDTSGAMMACKTDKAYNVMQKQFANHSVKREYYALLWGMPNPISGRIEKNIARNPHSRQEMTVVVDGGKPAITNYETLDVFSGPKFKPLALVKCLLETGRTHQIRVHLSYIGYPIYNDPVYNNKNATEFGQFLHSKTIDFTHPISKEHMHFESDLPEYFQNFLDKLE